jgi:hypothetical protein
MFSVCVYYTQISHFPVVWIAQLDVTFVENGGPGSSDGIAIDYGLDGPGFESRCGRDFSQTFSPALGPTQPSVQLVLGLYRG